MAIVPLDKVTLFGSASQKARVLDELQSLGCVHLITLGTNDGQVPELVSREARAAVKYLQTSPQHRRPARDTRDYNRHELIHCVLDVKQRRERLRDERDKLRQAMEDLQPWGEFRLPDLAAVGDCPFYFYAIPHQADVEISQTIPHEMINYDAKAKYVVVVGEPLPEELGQRPVELDSRPLSELRERLIEVEEEEDELSWRRVSLTRWLQHLQRDLDVADDQSARLSAAQRTWDDEHLFAVQGWAPRKQLRELEEFAEQFGMAVQVDKPRGDESPPTLLENPPVIGGAEPCVTFYMTPGYHAWDPTLVVYFSFSLFFGMIVSDAGYGLLMGVLLGAFWWRLSKSDQGRRFRSLMLGIVSATVVYGVLVGSYFGLAPPAGSLLDQLQVRMGERPMMENQNGMMILAVTIGVSHLVLASSISAWRHRGTARSFGFLGWAAIMLGGFLMGGSQLVTWRELWQAGQGMVIGGGLAVLLFSSPRPLLTARWSDHAWRLVDGVMQFANLSKAFGDVLSYLRLFALGLASAQLAMTFNDLAAGASARGGLGVLLAVLIVLVGHGINFLLALMGGVVHGLRLNCIEFFNWSLTEEGYAFHPLRKKAGV